MASTNLILAGQGVQDNAFDCENPGQHSNTIQRKPMLRAAMTMGLVAAVGVISFYGGMSMATPACGAANKDAANTLGKFAKKALRIDGLNTRRAAVTSAASALSLVPLAAFAELKKAGDAEIYARADAGKLNAARAIERVKTGDLVDGSSATCAELDKLIAVDREAVEYEKEKLEALGGSNTAQQQVVKDVEDKLQKQINRLKVIRKDKGCATAGANLKQASDFEVYKRADEGVLSSARVIQRAKEGKLVDGSGATCAELEKIISIDKKAVQFEKDKLEALGSKADPADKQTVAAAEKAIEAQLKKLAGLQKSKGC